MIRGATLRIPRIPRIPRVHALLRADREICRSRSSIRCRKLRLDFRSAIPRSTQRVIDVGCLRISRAASVERSPYRATARIANLANGLDELVRLQAVVKDELAARDATIDVIYGSGNEQAGVSWHEISPMRGRDNPILLSRPHKSTSVEVCT